jgi:hypothetical protein
MTLNSGNYDLMNANGIEVRKSIGYTRLYAERSNIATMTPRIELATSGYTSASLASGWAEHLVYLPEGRNVTVDLREVTGTLNVEWFNPNTGSKVLEDKKFGGGTHTFTAPFGGDAVLYIDGK